MSAVWTAFLEPFAYQFFVKGLLVATMAGLLCGLIGVYITLRGMSYIGHGLSHAVFGGFAASSVISLNYYLGAGIWGLASALAINRVSRSRRIGADAAIGVITTASFALGVVLLRSTEIRGLASTQPCSAASSEWLTPTCGSLPGSPCSPSSSSWPATVPCCSPRSTQKSPTSPESGSRAPTHFLCCPWPSSPP